MQMRVKLIILSAVTALGLAACNGGGGSSTGGGTYVPTPLTAAEIFANNMNAQDPYEDFIVAKDPTLSPGYIVLEDVFGEYWAIDLLTYDPNYDGAEIDYFWAYAIPVWYVGSGVYEDEEGYIYEVKDASAKDLEKIGAMVEKTQVRNLADQIASKYGLSEKRSVDIAKVVRDWKEISKKRSMTDADADAFSTHVLGFSVSDALAAYKKLGEGDATQVTDLINKAAEVNGTSPENIRDIMVDMVK